MQKPYDVRTEKLYLDTSDMVMCRRYGIITIIGAIVLDQVYVSQAFPLWFVWIYRGIVLLMSVYIFYELYRYLGFRRQQADRYASLSQDMEDRRLGRPVNPNGVLLQQLGAIDTMHDLEKHARSIAQLKGLVWDELDAETQREYLIKAMNIRDAGSRRTS